MVILTFISSILKLFFTVAIFGFVLWTPVLVVVGIIGLITKDYKYFKMALKVELYILGILVASILLFSIMLFLNNVLFG